SGLLARKGGARPAMRPVIDQSGGSFDDLGWNDMGENPEAGLPQHVPSSIAGLTPSPRLVRQERPQSPPQIVPVIEQRRGLEASFGEAPELEDAEARDFAPPPPPAEEIVETIEAEAIELPPVAEEAEVEEFALPPVAEESEAEVVALPPRSLP